MRNKYHGECYRCGAIVKQHTGHFERVKGGWRVQHAICCLVYKENTKEVAERIMREVAE